MAKYKERYDSKYKYKYMLNKYIEEAAQRGVVFKIEEYLPGTYEIRVVGETGLLRGVPIAKMPTLIHGLTVMGQKLREERMSVKWVLRGVIP